MTPRMRALVREWRGKGAVIEDQAADMIESICRKKMQIAGKGEDRRYLEVMFEDELMRYLFRGAETAKSYLMMARKTA